MSSSSPTPSPVSRATPTTGQSSSVAVPGPVYHPHPNPLPLPRTRPQHPPNYSSRSSSSLSIRRGAAHDLVAAPLVDALARKSRNPTAVARKLFAQAVSSTSTLARKPSNRSSLTAAAMPLVGHAPRVMGGGISGIPSHAASVTTSVARPTPSPAARARSASSPHQLQHSNGVGCGDDVMASLPTEKPQASTSGGAVTMTIQLAEPILFLQGFDQHEYSNRTPAMLRGSLILKIAKPTKIKAVTLTFRGRARTEWPEGIPPKKSEYFEEKEIMQHTWPFFNAHFPTAELGHCADSFSPKHASECAPSSLGSAISHLARSASPIGMAPAGGSAASDRRLSLQLAQSRSFSKGESPSGRDTVNARGFRVFQPGDYVYNFELPLESCLPETIDVDLGSVKYELEGVIERPGAFRPNLTGKKEVTLIRVPSETNLECTEPIAISRTWEDQLHYDIVISGKSFPLGSSIPIAFKLTPLAKVRCHRIKIFITENIEYSCKNKKVHRLDPTKKVQLFEKRAESPAVSAFKGSTVRVLAGGGFSPNDIARGNAHEVGNGSDNLLGDLNSEVSIGPTEMEFNVQLPGCNAKERERVHFDTTYPNIQVHHWIKIVMRLSKADPNDSSKRRHFEISIDSPFHILSCRATHANTTLPAYNMPPPGGANPDGSCTCPPLSRKNSPNSGTSTLRSTHEADNNNGAMADLDGAYGVSRPMHLLRYPSTNPPPFDSDIPPPLITPPPKYESVVNERNGGGLADYFARLADETPADEEDSDEDAYDINNHRRLMPPLTPGGRIARSMDEQRAWEPIANV